MAIHTSMLRKAGNRYSEHKERRNKLKNVCILNNPHAKCNYFQNLNHIAPDYRLNFHGHDCQYVNIDYGKLKFRNQISWKKAYFCSPWDLNRNILGKERQWKWMHRNRIDIINIPVEMRIPMPNDFTFFYI